MYPEEGQILTGPQFSEPVRVETVRADGPGSWVLGVVGTKTDKVSASLFDRGGSRTSQHPVGDLGVRRRSEPAAAGPASLCARDRVRVPLLGESEASASPIARS